MNIFPYIRVYVVITCAGILTACGGAGDTNDSSSLFGTPTPQPVATQTPEPTSTPNITPTPNVTPSPTETPIPVPTQPPEPSATPTPEPTVTPVVTPTPAPTLTPTPVATPTPVVTPTPIITPTPTLTPTPTATPTPIPTPTPLPSDLNFIGSEADAARFLAFAAFGGTPDEIRDLVGRDAADWLQEEINKAPTLQLPAIIQHRENGGTARVPYRNYVNATLLSSLMRNSDQLRTRMTLALSQILVVGNNVILTNFSPARSMQYVDVLTANAFGNYRNLIEQVTLSPAMSEWLSYINNDKGDPASGRMPDENYARELLQLFTVGLVQLNSDGTPVLDGDGQAIELYDNEDIVNLARVFTGYSYRGRRFGLNANDRNRALPLEIYDDHHSALEKNFLGVSIPPNTSGLLSLEMALDGIVGHANVAPFIGRQLIQRFTSSSPSASYVERVSTAFNSGRFISANGTEFGTGVRGDLEATIAAILLDESLFDNPQENAIQSGKVQEPLLSFIRWVRSFNIQDFDQITREFRLRDTGSVGNLQMRYFGSPSVFNFYRPGFVAPQTASGEQGLTVPEFQIFDTTFFFGYANFMADFVFDDTGIQNTCPAPEPNGDFNGVDPCNNDVNGSSFTPDYSSEIVLANDPLALVDRLDTFLTGDRMLPETRSAIIEAVESVDLTLGSSSEQRQREQRVKTAVFMTITSPAYIVVN